MKKIASLLVVVLLAGYSWYLNTSSRAGEALQADGSAADFEQTLARAYISRLSKVQVQGRGEVEKVLADDTKGSRHQKFILRLTTGQTLLFAHNIDLAPRIKNLQVGDRISFYGEYSWNERGGLVHWTHRDPAGRHAHGWLEHNGRRYQ